MQLQQFLPLLAVSGVLGNAVEPAPQSLDQPTTLFFTANTLTTGADPVPQLSCTGGSGAPFYRLANLSCTSLSTITEFSDAEVQWKCSTKLPNEFLLGSTTVSCQPWTDSQRSKDGVEGVSQVVVEGSCAVQYTLHLSDVGEKLEKTLKVLYNVADDLLEQHALDGATSEATGLVKYLFWTVFVGVASFILYSIFSNPATPLPNARRTQGPRGGGNGGDNDDGQGGRGQGGSGDWSPVNAHSVHALAAANRMQSASSGIQSPARGVTTRSHSSVAPPIVREDQGYDSSRPVSSFGGTVSR